jgi:hypothetical protein
MSTPKKFYRKTKKVMGGWRELEDFERVKPFDIAWSSAARNLSRCTDNPSRLLSGEAIYMKIFPDVLGNSLTRVKACEIMDILASLHAPVLGDRMVKRKYSLWRKQMLLPPRPESKCLPLP